MSPVITRAELCLLYPSAVWSVEAAPSDSPPQLPAISPLKCNSRLVPPPPHLLSTMLPNTSQ